LPIGLSLAVIGVAAVYLLFEPQYEASALLEINERAPFIAYEPKEDKSVFKAYFRTQMDIIRSRWIIGRAVEALKERNALRETKVIEKDEVIAEKQRLPEIFKRPDPIDWLRKQVTVTAGESDVFEIKYSSANPENAALVVNTVTEQYLNAQEKEDTDRNIQIVEALGKQMSAREEGVRALRKQVLTKTQEVEGKEPEAVRPDPGSPNKNPLGELQSKLIDFQVQKALLSAQIQASEEELAAAEKADDDDDGTTTGASGNAANKAAAPLSVEQPKLQDDAIRRAIANSPEIEQLKANLAQAKAELERIEKRSTKGRNDPVFIRQQAEIAIIAKGIKQQEKKIADDVPMKMKLAAAPLSKEETELRDAMVWRAVEDNAEVKQWYSLLIPKQMQLLQIETTADLGKLHPSYIKLEKEIGKAEQKLEELKQKLAAPIQKEVEFSLRANRRDSGDNAVMILAKRREELARMRNTLRSYELAEAHLREEYHTKLDTFLKQLKNVSEENVELTFKKDELKEKEGVLARIAERQIALQTERSAPTRVIWHEKAKASEAPGDMPYGYMALAGVVGLCLPYAAGLLALVLWNLGKLIRKLEPLETDAVTPASSPN